MGQTWAKAVGVGIPGALVVISHALLGIPTPLAWVIPGSMALGTIIGIAA